MNMPLCCCHAGNRLPGDVTRAIDKVGLGALNPMLQAFKGMRGINHLLVAQAVEYIARNLGPGAILVILPGWADIVGVHRLLE